MNTQADQTSRKQERNTFLLLTIVLVPLLAIVLVGGLGLVIWLYQLVMGPPGPPTA